jgi:hypothetical protein
MTDEQRDLDNLTKHPGWLIFTDHGTKDIAARLNLALANAANGTDDALAINQVRQCVAVKQAVEALMRWPDDRLKVLQQAAAAHSTTPALSRRGTL